MWFELPLALFCLALLVGTRFVPPECRYLSFRKRRAMKLALQEFARAKDIRPDRTNCRIYKTDAERSIVLIPHVSNLHPPILAFYSVPHDSDRADHIGSGQCHWGIQPEDVWENHSINSIPR